MPSLEVWAEVRAALTSLLQDGPSRVSPREPCVRHRFVGDPDVVSRLSTIKLVSLNLATWPQPSPKTLSSLGVNRVLSNPFPSIVVAGIARLRCTDSTLSSTTLPFVPAAHSQPPPSGLRILNDSEVPVRVVILVSIPALFFLCRPTLVHAHREPHPLKPVTMRRPRRFRKNTERSWSEEEAMGDVPQSPTRSVGRRDTGFPESFSGGEFHLQTTSPR